MSQTTTPRRQIETRASNKTAHPGYVDKSKSRRATAEVQKERTAKADAKAAREKARENSINLTAEFEANDMVEEGLADATPRPPFTPKPPRNRTCPNVTPLTLRAKSIPEVSDDSDDASSMPPGSESTLDSSNSAVESPPPSPPKKKGISRDRKVATSATTKAGKKNKVKVDDSEPEVDPEVPPAEPLQLPKGKKGKKKIREEINTRVAAKRTHPNADSESGYGEVTPKQGASSLKAPQPKAVGGRKGLKREGAMLNITASKRSKKNKDDDDTEKTAVPSNKPALSTSGHITAGTATGSHSSGTTSRRSSAQCVLTDNVGIISHGTICSAKVITKPAPDPETITVDSDGGPSDRDEKNCEERLAAVNSPLKGNKRVSSEHLVRIDQKPSERTFKKGRSEELELPDYVSTTWFRSTFVSTYVAYVGQTADPWDVPVKRAVEVMQMIWNATSADDYEIAPHSGVYKKTVQRCADAWRNTIGTTGITTLLTYLDSREDLRDSDEKRKAFALRHLEKLRFLYKDYSGGGDENNSDCEDKAKWKGAFRSPLVVQVFAVHLSVTEGAKMIPGLHGPNKATPTAIGGLGMACASVERALSLVAAGTLTIEIANAANASKGKMTLPRTFNLSTGKDSTRQTGFTDAAWGDASRSFAASARNLSRAKFNAIIKGAQGYMKPNRRRATDVKDIINVDDDERACVIASDSESDEECKLLSFLYLF